MPDINPIKINTDQIESKQKTVSNQNEPANSIFNESFVEHKNLIDLPSFSNNNLKHVSSAETLHQSKNGIIKNAEDLLTAIQNDNLDTQYENLINKFKTSSSEQLEKDISTILRMAGNQYDISKNYGKLEGSKGEILQNILTYKEDTTIKNLICTTGHNFVAQALRDAGIPAVVARGVMSNTTEGHAILLYKNKEGNYVYQDWGMNINEIKADNILDALRQIYKNKNSFQSIGILSINKDSNNNYEELLYKDEVAFAETLDTKNIKKTSAFDNKKVQDYNSIQVSGSILNNSDSNNPEPQLGNIKASLTTKIDNNKQLDFEIESKNIKNTQNADTADSLGAKVGYTQEFNPSDKDKIYLNANGTLSHINAEANSILTNRLFLDGEINAGYERILVNNKDSKLTLNTNAKANSLVYFLLKDKDVFSRNKTVLDTSAGLKYENNIGPVYMKTAASVGGGMDITRRGLDVQRYYPMGYVKGNLEGALSITPNPQFQINMSANGFVNKDNVSLNYGIDADANLQYKPNNNIGLIAGLQYNNEQTHLSMYDFNENIQDKNNITAYLGSKIGKNVQVFGSYSQDLNSNEKTGQIGLKANF